MNQDKKGTVLVVDDDPASLSILFELLRQANFKVLIAEDGESALKRVNRLQPDIILLDIMMPDINGFELCRRLKESNKAVDTPVIFLSGLSEIANKARALEMNAVDYITKPFQPEEVIARVEKHFTIHNLQKKLEEQNRRLQQEITERKQAEESLRELNATLETQVAGRTVELTQAVERLEHVRAIGEAVATATTLQSGRASRLNTRRKSLTGYSRQKPGA